MNLVTTATVFATAAHSAVGQKRKYTGEDYITHPISVARILVENVITASDEMIAAALLHDVLEDTQVTREQLLEMFGLKVTEYVAGLTDVSKPSDGNRSKRKELDRRHLVVQCAEVQTIKCADIIHNTNDIVTRDKDFAKVYLSEVMALVTTLDKANPHIRAKALSTVVDGLRQVHQS